MQRAAQRMAGIAVTSFVSLLMVLLALGEILDGNRLSVVDTGRAVAASVFALAVSGSPAAKSLPQRDSPAKTSPMVRDLPVLSNVLTRTGVKVTGIRIFEAPSEQVLAFFSPRGLSEEPTHSLEPREPPKQFESRSVYSYFTSGSTLNGSPLATTFVRLPSAPANPNLWIAVSWSPAALGEVRTVLIAIGVATGTVFGLASGMLFRRARRPRRPIGTVVPNWVRALVVDPFISRPESPMEMDPLSEVILDVRSRLHLQESLLKSIITSAPLVIIHLSTDFVVQMVNSSMTSVTGLTEQDSLGKTACRLLEMLGVEKVPEIFDLRRMRVGDRIRNVELSITHHLSREARQVLCSVAVNNLSSGGLTGYTVFVEDITTRKQWEAYTTQSDRLNLVAEFAASTAHEIRNPLTTVRGFLQLQKRRNPQSTDSDHYQIMIEEIDRVDELISEYLTLARHSVVSERHLLRVSSIIWDLLPLITAEANMKGVMISIGDLPEAECAGNSRELKQVFLNLIKNALDAMASGGTLTIHATHARGLYTVAISDTGCGIEKDKLKQIFDPFFTTKSTGSGLGLSVSKKIIEAHQGQIDVESIVGEGTTFYVILPDPP